MKAEIHRVARALAAERRRSVQRIAMDLVLWAGPVAIAISLDHPLVSVMAILWIGAVPMHDLLVHGHEGTHGLIAKRVWVNELFTWLTHALVGIVGTAYRAFHLDHHRFLRADRDPELRLLRSIAPAVPGWAYLGLPPHGSCGREHLPTAEPGVPFRSPSRGA